MWIGKVLLLAILLVSERLMREDYLRQRVPKTLTLALLILGFLLSGLRLCVHATDLESLLYALTYILLNAFLLTFPLLLLYRLRRQPGPADIKYCFFLGLVFDFRKATLLILMAALWAFASEFWKSRQLERRKVTFAFLPYLIISSLPFVFIDYWNGVKP